MGGVLISSHVVSLAEKHTRRRRLLLGSKQPAISLMEFHSVPPWNATFIDVSWTRDSKKDEEGIAKIQQKTAEMSDIQFKGKDESTRANELKQRLQKEKEQEKDKDQKIEKILIILDDIWKKLIWRKLEFLSKMIRQYAN